MKKVTIINPDGSENESKFDKFKKKALKILSKAIIFIIAIGVLYLLIITSIFIFTALIFAAVISFLVVKFRSLK